MKFNVQKREVVGKGVKHLRKDGLVPATIYGPKYESINIQFNSKEFKNLINEVGYSKFVQIEIEGNKAVRALIKDVDIHPIKDYYQSVSFYAVDEDSKLYVDVPIILQGESPAVSKKLGFLVNPIENITVHCLPKDLPEEFSIDLSTLENVGDTITVGDVTLPDNVDLSSSMDTTSALAYIAAPQRVIETDEEADSDDEEGENSTESENNEEAKESAE